MQRRPNRVFRVLLIVIAAYGALWTLTAAVGPRAVRPPMISALAIDDSFRELRTTKDVYDVVGHVYALQFSSYAPFRHCAVGSLRSRFWVSRDRIFCMVRSCIPCLFVQEKWLDPRKA